MKSLSAKRSRTNARLWSGQPIHVYLVTLAILIALSGLLAAAYVRASGINDAEAAVRNAANFTADLAVSEIESDLEELAATTSGLAATPNLGEILNKPEDCSLTFSGLGAFPEGQIDVIDPQGTVVCSSSAQLVDAGTSYRDDPWFEQALRESSVASPVTRISPDRSAFVNAVRSDSGVMVATFLELEGVGSTLSSQFRGPRDFEFLVVDRADDRIVSRSIEPSRWTGERLPGPAWPERARVFQHADVDGEMRYYGGASVPELDWIVYAGAERAQTLAAAQELFQKTSIIVGIGLVLTLLVLWIVWRTVARPIHSLQLAIGDAASDPNRDLVQVGGPAEIVALGQEFDRVLKAMSHELAERERAESALQTSEHSYRFLFEKNPEPMWIYDIDSLSFLQVNDTACEHYGYSRQQWLDMTVKDIRPPEDVPALIQSVDASEAFDRSGPWRHIKADGDVIEVEITSHEIDFGGHRGRFVMANDVTERRHLENQLSQSQRLESLGQLAGGIAHDFNNLLGVILNYSAFVHEALEGTDPDELRQARVDLEQISGAANRAASLTRRLLMFARKEVAHPEVLDPNSLVEEVDKLLRRTIGEEIVFSTTVSPDVWPVRIDPGQLQQVILNLVVNARDAMPDGGNLTVETSNVDVDADYAANWAELEAGRYIRIRVSDTGAGIDPQVVDRIFDPFFTTKPTGEGTGLGLATVHGIVTQVGGSIHVYTEHGVGTSISVLLPANDQPVAEENEVKVGTLGGEESVLVIEDEEAIREMMRRILTRHGYDVTLAATGTEAIEIAADMSVEIDVVITDVVMPGMMGREVSERMSELRPETPLIYVSGYAPRGCSTPKVAWSRVEHSSRNRSPKPSC
jgi:PAS domain S-box-containing protein